MPIDLSQVSDEDLAMMLGGGGGGVDGGVDMGGEVQAVQPMPVPVEGPGASFGERLGAAFKGSPEGQAGFYQAQRGDANVRVNNGAVELLDPATGQWGPANPSGLDWGDLADLISAAPEATLGGAGAMMGATAGSIVPGAGTAAGMVGGGAAGTALGNVVKQAIGAALPGAENMTLGERAGETAVSGAVGLAAGAIGPLARGAGRMIAGGTGAEARAIEAGIGSNFRFGAGDVAGGGPLKSLQDKVGRSFMGQREAAALLNRNITAVERKMDDIVGRFGTDPKTDEELGQALVGTLRKADADLTTARRADAGTRFAAVDSATGNVPNIDPVTFRQTLQGMVKQGTMSNRQKTAQAKDAAALLKKTPRRLTARDAQIMLEEYGHVGYATGATDILPNLGISDRVKISKRLFASLQGDLDTTIRQYREVIGPDGPAELLRAARTNYATHMQAAERLRESALSRLIGRATEVDLPAIPGRIMSKLKHPDQIKGLMAQLKTMNPAVHAEVQQHALEQALTAARAAAQTTAGGAGALPLRGATLRKALEDPRLKAMFADKPGLVDELDTVQKGLARLGGDTAAGSPSAYNAEVLGGLGALVTPGAWPGLVVYLGTTKAIAKVMFNPELRDAAKRIANSRALSPEARIAAATLTAGLASGD